MKIENKLLALSNNCKNIAEENASEVKEDFLSIFGNELKIKEDLIEIKKNNIKYESDIEDKYIVEYENSNSDENTNSNENLIELIIALFNNIKVIDQTQKNEEIKILDLNEFNDSMQFRFDKKILNLKEMFNDDVIKNQLGSVGLNEKEIQKLSDKLYGVIRRNIKITNNQNNYSDRYLDILNYRDNSNFMIESKLNKLNTNTNTSNLTVYQEDVKLENSNIISDLKTVFNNEVNYELNNVSLSEEQVELINENVKKLSGVYFEKSNEIIVNEVKNLKNNNIDNVYLEQRVGEYLSIEKNGFIDERIKYIKEVMNAIENNSDLNSIKSNASLLNIISELRDEINSYSSNDRVIENEIIINSNINNEDILKLEDLELTFNKDIISENIKIENEVDNELNILNKIAFDEVKSRIVINNNQVKKVNIELVINNKDDFLNDIDSDFKEQNIDTILNFNNIATNSYTDKNTAIKQPQNIRNGYITQDIVEAINYLNTNNIEELSVKMNPEDLGEINVKLIKTKSEEKCIITLSKEESFNLIKENINEIKTHLSNLEINMKEISVEIKSNNQNGFSDNLNQHFNKNNTKDQQRNNRQEIEENEIVKDSNENILNIDLMV